MRGIKLGLTLSLGSAVLQAQVIGRPNILPAPTGALDIGRVTYHWVDSSRAAFLESTTTSRRDLIVDVWYPAIRKANRPQAPYLPDLPHLQRVLGAPALRHEFAPAYLPVEAGSLRTHASEGTAAKCPAGNCPLLIFSHGGGVDRSFYSSQYEDLASHGYIVAVIAHTYDTHLVVFPDGRALPSAPGPRETLPLDSTLPRWRRDLQREARSQAYVRQVIAVEVGDIRFVIDQMSRYARDARLNAPFLRQLNLKRIGAIGHSAGGQAAAFACQVDGRLKACLNQDGVMHNRPFTRDAAGRTMNQPFMYIGRAHSPPQLSDDQLASMEMTRVEADSLFRALAAGQDDLLSDMPAGAYRITLRTPGITHMSFSDEPLIEAAGDSAKTANALLTLRLIETYSRAFFDRTLLGRTTTVLDRPTGADAAIVTVERFSPSATRHLPPK